MPDAIEMKEIIGRLCDAQASGVIKSWKVLGPLILVRTRDRSVYVPFDAARSFLEELTADC